MRWTALFALAAALPGQTPPPHPVDLRTESCTAANPSGHGEAQCYATAEKEWDTELNRAYRELQAAASPAGKARLLTAQKAWLAFRDAEFALIDELYGASEGSMFLPMRAFRRMDIVRARARDLTRYARLPR